MLEYIFLKQMVPYISLRYGEAMQQPCALLFTVLPAWIIYVCSSLPCLHKPRSKLFGVAMVYLFNEIRRHQELKLLTSFDSTVALEYCFIDEMGTKLTLTTLYAGVHEGELRYNIWMWTSVHQTMIPL